MLGFWRPAAGWLEAPKLYDLMTCLEALLDVIESFGLSLIFMDLGVFQDRRFENLWHRITQ
jgi:hypothetical protein